MWFKKQRKRGKSFLIGLILAITVGSCASCYRYTLPSESNFLKLEWFESVVRIRNIHVSNGAGFVISSTGGPRPTSQILSVAHVCEGIYKAKRSIVIDFHRKTHEILWVKISHKSDLCLLNIEGTLPAFSISEEYPKRGNKVYIIGHPGGLRYIPVEGLAGSYMTPRTPDKLGWKACTESEPENQEQKEFCNKMGIYPNVFFPTLKVYTAKVSAGNSGSPVIDIRGDIVGVVSRLQKIGRFDKSGFALAVSYWRVKDFLEEELRYLPEITLPNPKDPDHSEQALEYCKKYDPKKETNKLIKLFCSTL